MNTTINDIITNTLKGKQVTVYEYDALFVYQNPRRISHWYINDNDVERNNVYKITTHWQDLQIKKHRGEIIAVSGYYMDYEGTHITMTVNVNGEEKHISIHMEDILEIHE